MFEVISPLALALVFVLAVTPLVRKLAIKLKAIDQPEERKVHQTLMPRMGGLAICLSFWAVVLLTQGLTREIIGLLTGGFVICLLGLWDDLRGVNPKVKLLVQILAAGIIVFAGIRVDYLTHPLADIFHTGYFSYPLTILWIIGITNAVNLIDGLDGLAVGVSAIAALTLGIVACLEGLGQIGMLAFILACSSFGFLRYNFYPAKIFMGDTGSLFLGFNLAVLAIMGLTKSTTVISLFLPVIILGIPILDTILAIFRRYYSGKPIFSADKEHLHHRLLDIGLSHRGTVLAIYGVSLILGLSAILMASLSTPQGMLIMLFVTSGVFITADKMGILKKEHFKIQAKGKKAVHPTAK